MSNFGRMVKARQEKYGESYAVAARHVRAQVTVASDSSDPPDDRFSALAAVRHDGDVLKQMVLTGPWDITYSLSADGTGLGLSVGGVGATPMPAWLMPTARDYARINKVRLVGMLQAARHGVFHVYHGGVVAGRLRTARGELSAWFTSWDDDRPVMNRTSGVDYDLARAIAVAAFVDVPEEVRKRLFRIARPHDPEVNSPNR